MIGCLDGSSLCLYADEMTYVKDMSKSDGMKVNKNADNS